MATSTILRELRIKDKTKARAFVNALEKAQTVKSKDVRYTRAFEDVKGDKIRNIFEIK